MTAGSGQWPDSFEFWRDKSVVVTGGAGFLGSFVVEKLRQRGAANVFVSRSRDYDLRQLEAVRQLLTDARPDMVIHLASRVGGIAANRPHVDFHHGKSPEAVGISRVPQSRRIRMSTRRCWWSIKVTVVMPASMLRGHIP